MCSSFMSQKIVWLSFSAQKDTPIATNNSRSIFKFWTQFIVSFHNNTQQSASGIILEVIIQWMILKSTRIFFSLSAD